MRGIAYDRIKRGVALASVGAAFLLPAAAAQASPPPWAPAYGYWTHGPGSQPTQGAQSSHGGAGQQSGGKITGHRIG